MIGRKKLSEIRLELQEAYAAEGINPIIELDNKIRKLKKSKPAKDDVVKDLETFREALSEILEEEVENPARPKRAKTTKKKRTNTGETAVERVRK
ncbi:MAG: hypothetical protein FJ303_12350 [Planctomycetes bacterium]|nr:hypothetical protein [Planctomycetota bacterium]